MSDILLVITIAVNSQRPYPWVNKWMVISHDEIEIFLHGESLMRT